MWLRKYCDFFAGPTFVRQNDDLCAVYDTGEFVHTHTRGGQKVLSLDILDNNFFTIYILVKRTIFNNSNDSAADMAYGVPKKLIWVGPNSHLQLCC